MKEIDKSLPDEIKVKMAAELVGVPTLKLIKRILQKHDETAIDVMREQVQRIELLENRLREIAEYAHNESTGPAIPDALWEIREQAYELI